MNVLVTCKYEEDPIKNEGARVDNIFPIITLWELFVAMETRVPILPGPKPNAINTLPQCCLDKIWLQLAHWLRRYSSLKMFTDPQTDARTDGRTDAGSTDIL